MIKKLITGRVCSGILQRTVNAQLPVADGYLVANVFRLLEKEMGAFCNGKEMDEQIGSLSFRQDYETLNY